MTTKTKYIKKITEHEQKTYELFSEYLTDPLRWSSKTQLIANVYNAYSAYSYSLEQLERIVCALNGFDKIDLKKSVAKLTRAKVLRSRVGTNYDSKLQKRVSRRVYEVNY